MTKIGQNIRKFREIRNLTQAGLAKELGISQSNYARIEKDEVKVNEERLQKIADILNTTVESIKGFDDKVVFNFQNITDNGIAANNINHNYQISPEIKKLYEDKINLLEEKVQLLEEQLRQKS